MPVPDRSFLATPAISPPAAAGQAARPAPGQAVPPDFPG
jgi:hypothetical protein